ncbi:5'-nucleotidase; exopolyphosphatase; 3'-nucleotidase [Paludibacter propionicigenes WB4]|uniref:5'-nucleotidase SurE n=1 Tax=Paludibacter propionicigenes (strain DSM 17365 / JCM 13257 / WB4) TaxID=694427 RepID=E4T8P6_PALPW|nr:5'/3'-nucleotidase SurE [Paludibacter propionicigenes]ADQ81155.1 5'-nucleotidase; exopolyphosphatase; 3'-nucleotidase [Paludibacter propionicigenes WB4]
MNKPLILITNDDGHDANGIAVLTRLMMKIGDVVVVAPDGPRSAQSNALTVTHPIRFKKIEETEGLIRYICTGTPTDCVKLALNEIVERKPDLVVAGINHGSNAAVNVIYSGTMGAVLEGCENGILSIGFSICDHSMDADFSVFEPCILKITREALRNGLPHATCLNVNAPVGEIKGVKVARQCDGRWTKEYAKRTDPRGGSYFWLTGNFENHEPESTDTDEWALSQGYISIVPTKIDLTAYQAMDEICGWEF